MPVTQSRAPLLASNQSEHSIPSGYEKTYEEEATTIPDPRPRRTAATMATVAIKSAGVPLLAPIDNSPHIVGLDLSLHPVPQLLKLPDLHKFSDVHVLRQMMNGPNGPRLFDVIVNMLHYANAADERAAQDYDKMKAKADEDYKKREIAYQRKIQKMKVDFESTLDQADATESQPQKELEIAQNQFTSAQSSGSNLELDKAKSDLRKERQDHLKTGKDFDEALRGATQLQAELSNLKKNPVATGAKAFTAGTAAIDPTSNYRARGVESKKPLTDKTEFRAWRHAVRAKFKTNGLLYPTGLSRVNYAVSQFALSVFDAMETWIEEKKASGSLTVEQLFDEIKHFMGISALAADAKRELLTASMGNETVDEYYHKLMKLWKYSKISEKDRMVKFKESVKPWLSQPLYGFKYTSMRDLLDAIRDVESQRKATATHFPLSEPKPAAKQNGTWNTPRASGGSAVSGGSATSGGFAGASGKSNMAKDKSVRDINDVNARFKPMATKPADWVGEWFDPEANPKKIEGNERQGLQRQGRCWACRGPGHRRSDDCCPGNKKRMDVGRVTELSNSDSENA
ncbi:hypothetical protein MMC07_009690 [Pseudocyphellaria aurata]|nr:hypothetical protein [Pseudocyphellaria aurata]